MKMFGMEIPPKKKEESKESEVLNEQKDNLETMTSPEMIGLAKETVEKVTRLQALLEKAKNMVKDEAETTKEGFSIIKQKLEEFAANKKVQNLTEWTLIAAVGFASYKLLDNTVDLYNEQAGVGNYAMYGVPLTETLEKLGSLGGGLITGLTSGISAAEKIKGE